MPVSRERLRWLVRPALFVAVALSALALIATAGLIWLERGWAEPTLRGPEAAFREGTIGTELMPLPVAHALPVLFPEHFQPAGEDAGDWVEQFGFLRYEDPAANDGLPVGFAVTRYRPASAAPSPVAFVGFSCALCHTTAIRTAEDDPGRVITGPGSVSLNLFAWLDAFQAALLARQPLAPGEVADPAKPAPYRMTTAEVAEAYRTATGREMDMLERIMVGLWFDQIRARLESGLERFDEPFGHGLSRDAAFVPTGPTRTQPFRTLIRQVLGRPGNDMAVYTKIATVFSEDFRRRAQFDGSIADLYARSSLAAFAAGATIENMRTPEIAHNIRAASDFTLTLRPPPFAELFPEHVPDDPAWLARGKEVYRAHCFGCHGDRGESADSWTDGPLTHQVTNYRAVGTDPERVLFRHYDVLAERMYQLFPQDHPFHFARETMWPQRGEENDLSLRGYVNAPLDGLYLRAPYLHNGSVLTLAELINLKRRRDTFWRGRNLYDPVDVGFVSPPAADAQRYFLFDTAVKGNANRGHDYPWAYDDPQRNVADLEALLDYLKTL